MNEKNIGSIISKLREEKGLTQKELADKLNISDKAISKWETNANLPNIDMIFKISRLFKVSFQNLLKARLEEEKIDEKLIKDIMNEFSETNNRKIKIIKIGFVIALILSLILIITILFTRSYNRFKVYGVNVESNDAIALNGIYVETRLKDVLNLNKIKIKGREIKSSDTTSVDIYILDNDEKKVIYTSSDLSISFSNYQTYIKIDDLTEYLDNLYIKVTIIDSKNKISEYEDQLKFKINFSNNKIYNKETKTNFTNQSLDKDYIKEKLLENGFKETSTNILSKNNKKISMLYYYDANKLNYQFEKDNFYYRYVYNFNRNCLEVSIFDKNNVEIENYLYDVSNEEVLECNTGSCNNYSEAIKTLNDNVLNYLYENA